MNLRRILSWAPTIPALLGFLFCLWNTVAPETVPCQTAGCALYGTGTESNILWHAGMAAFGLLIVLSAWRKKYAARPALFFLACDIPLLVFLVLTAPCAKCLAVGLIFFWTACAADYWRIPSPGKRFSHRAVPCIWLVAFAMNLGVVASDTIPSWSMAGDPKTAILVAYVSPTCPYCLKAIERYERHGDKVAFLPIIKDRSDFSRIVCARLLAEKEPERALSGVMAEAGREDYERPSTPVLVSRLPILLRCLVNTARSLSSGAHIVPIVEFRGLPQES